MLLKLSIDSPATREIVRSIIRPEEAPIEEEVIPQMNHEEPSATLRPVHAEVGAGLPKSPWQVAEMDTCAGSCLIDIWATLTSAMSVPLM